MMNNDGRVVLVVAKEEVKVPSYMHVVETETVGKYFSKEQSAEYRNKCVQHNTNLKAFENAKSDYNKKINGLFNATLDLMLQSINVIQSATNGSFKNMIVEGLYNIILSDITNSAIITDEFRNKYVQTIGNVFDARKIENQYLVNLTNSVRVIVLLQKLESEIGNIFNPIEFSQNPICWLKGRLLAFDARRTYTAFQCTSN